jgi:hypothetical protein
MASCIAGFQNVSLAIWDGKWYRWLQNASFGRDLGRQVVPLASKMLHLGEI